MRCGVCPLNFEDFDHFGRNFEDFENFDHFDHYFGVLDEGWMNLD